MSTYTYVTLEVSLACFEEIRARLDATGYSHAFIHDSGGMLIDMHGIALQAAKEPDPTPHADAEARKQTRAGKPTL